MVVMCVENYSGTAFISRLDDNIWIMPQVCWDGHALCDGGVKEQFNFVCDVGKESVGGGGIQPDALWDGWGVNGLPLK